MLKCRRVRCLMNNFSKTRSLGVVIKNVRMSDILTFFRKGILYGCLNPQPAVPDILRQVLPHPIQSVA